MLRRLTFPFTFISSDGFFAAAVAGTSTAMVGSTTTPATATPAVSTVLRLTWGMSSDVLGADTPLRAASRRPRPGGCASGTGEIIPLVRAEWYRCAVWCRAERG